MEGFLRDYRVALLTVELDLDSSELCLPESVNSSNVTIKLAGETPAPENVQ